MASHIKKGESIFIPFRDGISISDSQLKPRMYKTIQAFEKSFPSYYLGTAGVELVEYAEVVRCKDCEHSKPITILNENRVQLHCRMQYGLPCVEPDEYCSRGERINNENNS